MKKTIFSFNNLKITVSGAVRAFTAALAGCAALILLFSAPGFYNETQAVRLKNATALIREAAANCYALEGKYPDDLNYLVKNYGIVLEYEKYVYTYEIENGRPYIEVRTR